MDPAEGAMHTWLERQTPSGSSQRTPGAVFRAYVLMGSTHCSGVTTETRCWQLGRCKSSFFCGSSVLLVGYPHALQWLTNVPGGCLPGWLAQGTQSLVQCDCSVTDNLFNMFLKITMECVYKCIKCFSTFPSIVLT